MKIKNFKFKSDEYRRARGGYSRFLNLYCYACGNYLLLYQKDGPGPLKRAYLDRIFAPDKLLGLENLGLKNVPVLKCVNCHTVIGKPYIYDKENRKAYLLDKTAFIKKITKGIYPPEISNLSK